MTIFVGSCIGSAALLLLAKANMNIANSNTTTAAPSPPSPQQTTTQQNAAMLATIAASYPTIAQVQAACRTQAAFSAFVAQLPVAYVAPKSTTINSSPAIFPSLKGNTARSYTLYYTDSMTSNGCVVPSKVWTLPNNLGYIANVVDTYSLAAELPNYSYDRSDGPGYVIYDINGYYKTQFSYPGNGYIFGQACGQ